MNPLVTSLIASSRRRLSPYPRFTIPLASNATPSNNDITYTFTRNSTATYVDDAGIEHTVGINVPLFRNGRYLPQTLATNIFLQSGTPATKTITVVSGSKYTVSCYGSGSIALSGAITGTVVQGTPVTFTAASTTLTCVPSAIDKAQVELGSQATSYIPTTTVPMTRASDVLHYNVSSVITQGQGSLYCEMSATPYGSLQRVIYLSDGTVGNRVLITLNPNLVAYITYAGSTQAAISITTIPSGVLKCLITYKNNEVSFYVNGINIGTDLSCTIPTNLSRLSIGCSPTGSEQLNGEIGNIKYYKEVLTEAEAIKLTTI